MDHFSQRVTTGSSEYLQGAHLERRPVRAYRAYHNLCPFDRTDDKPSETLTLNEAASILGVCAMTVRRLIGRGILPAVQPARWLPWSIRRSDLDDARVQQAVQASKDYRPLTGRRDTKTLKIPGL